MTRIIRFSIVTTTVAALWMNNSAPLAAQFEQAASQSPTIAAWPLGGFERFAVTADGGQTDLGSWSKVDGLQVSFDVVDYRAGGGTITLHRPVSRETLLVRDWLEGLAASFQPTSLTISLYDAVGTPVTTWKFSGVFPTKWQITLDNASSVAIETLVLAYETLEVTRRDSRR